MTRLAMTFACCAMLLFMTTACGGDDSADDDSTALTSDDDDDASIDDDGGDDDTWPPLPDDDADDDADDDTSDDDSDDDVDDDADDDTDDDVDDDIDDDADPIDIDIPEGCNPFATSDECLLPYPSAFYQIDDPTTETGKRVNYPEDAVEMRPGKFFDVTMINTADGSSPASPILVHFGRDVDPDVLTNIHEMEESLTPGNPVALFNMDTGERVLCMVEMDMNRRNGYDGRYAFIVRPMEPMQNGARHVVVLTDHVIGADGEPFTSPPAFAALRDDVPTTNAIVEDVRPEYEEIFDFLDSKDYDRDDLLLAWDFTVASEDYILGSVLSMRDATLEQAANTGFSYTLTLVQKDPNANLAYMVQGDFTPPNYLNDDSEFNYDADHHPIAQGPRSYPFTMIVPKKAYDGEPLPLVVFGHGLFGSGRSYLAGWGANIFQSLAQEHGVVMIATDWIGLSEGDLELIIEELLPDLNRIRLVTDRLQQSLVNNLAMTEMALADLQFDDQIDVGDHDLLDDARVHYYGVSLGGIQGASFVAISQRLDRAVLAVPGAVWSNLLSRSVNWLLVKVLMDVFYPDPLIQQIGIAVMQSLFDHADPVNISQLMYRRPLPDAPEERVVLLQESIGDSQVPNMSTEVLARAMGADLLTPAIYDVIGLDGIPAPTTQPVMTQIYLVDQALANFPPDENVPPSGDNGVHSDAVLLPHVLDQVTTLLETGVIQQYCSGLCDPD
ncbi:MAG: hypothetical protein KJ042_00280 [Deltaproteobacteria bacterium]|nr:hypothetical protein [Deltaproteobacteria bacterium]